jgi:hypothetical protein
MGISWARRAVVASDPRVGGRRRGRGVLDRRADGAVPYGFGLHGVGAGAVRTQSYGGAGQALLGGPGGLFESGSHADMGGARARVSAVSNASAPGG